MNKKLKKAIIAVLAVAAVCAAIWGSLVLIRNARRDEVNVYAVSDFMSDDINATAGTSGTVTSDKLQKVYLSETQTVNQIYVEEGQTVHKGDKLIACDTSLSNGDLQQAQIDLERQQIELKSLKAQLEKLLNAKNVDQLENEKAALEKKLQVAQYEAGITDKSSKPVLPSGDGSANSPKCIVWDEESDRLTQSKMSELLGSDDSAYVLLVSDDGDGYSKIQGLHIYRPVETDEIVISFVSDLQIPEIDKNDSVKSLEAQIAELDGQIAEAHSKAELLTLQSAKRKEIANAEIDIKIASIHLRQLQSEIQDGVIYSNIDGVVKTVRDEDEARNEGSAVIEVSGGGGYYIDGAISELALDTVKIGQSVEVNSWMNGTYCEGTVAEISTYPTTDFSSWGDGNPNVSYYPMKVFVEEDANLQDGDMVDMTYRSDGDKDSWYIESMFVRSENGSSYVYVRNDNGTLEKRTIQAGCSMNGYTEILGGLTVDDFVAFPYGKDVTDGAKTRESTMEELYGW